MIESIEIENFKNIKNLSLSGFQKINIIVGDNAGGKTSLLEAMQFLFGNSPIPNISSIKTSRSGEHGFQIPNDSIENAQRHLYGDFFHNFNMELMIKIHGEFQVQDNKHKRYLNINKQIANDVYNSSSGPSNSSISFQWNIGEKHYIISPIFTQTAQTGIHINPNPNNIDFEKIFCIHFNPSMNINTGFLATNFWSLDDEKKNKLKDLFKFKKLEIGVILDRSYLCGIPEKANYTHSIPIYLISSGLNRLMGIFISLMSSPEHTILLIDEAEVGFYYERYPLFWKTLFDFATTQNLQIFLTTHSREFIQSIEDSLDKEQIKTNFTLTRMKEGQGKIFSGNILEAVLHEESEMR